MEKLGEASGIDKQTAKSLLDDLEKTELVIPAPPFSSGDAVVRKPTKYVFMGPVLRSSLLDVLSLPSNHPLRVGGTHEDAVALVMHRLLVATDKASLFHDPAEGTADFIVRFVDGRKLAIEVGAGDKKEKQVVSSMTRHNIDKGLVISGESTPRLGKDKRVLFLPFEYLMMV
jgi:predicted AAA+ superfamily ATPase